MIKMNCMNKSVNCYNINQNFHRNIENYLQNFSIYKIINILRLIRSKSSIFKINFENCAKFVLRLYISFQNYIIKNILRIKNKKKIFFY